VHPLPALGSLTSDVDKSEIHFVNGKRNIVNSGRTDLYIWGGVRRRSEKKLAMKTMEKLKFELTQRNQVCRDKKTKTELKK
jgi:hypothetical protein